MFIHYTVIRYCYYKSFAAFHAQRWLQDVAGRDIPKLFAPEIWRELKGTCVDNALEDDVDQCRLMRGKEFVQKSQNGLGFARMIMCESLVGESLDAETES